jgi:DNA-directed RNA polymerase beta' subunit
MLGGSLNYTSRNVIVPDPTLKDNEVDLSYHTFLEVFKYKIINNYMKIYDTNLSTAYAVWKSASTFDQRIYDIMMYIVQQDDIRILINRNPTLNFYSMLLMKVRDVKADDTDYTLSVPLSINHGKSRHKTPLTAGNPC